MIPRGEVGDDEVDISAGETVKSHINLEDIPENMKPAVPRKRSFEDEKISLLISHLVIYLSVWDLAVWTNKLTVWIFVCD